METTASMAFAMSALDHGTWRNVAMDISILVVSNAWKHLMSSKKSTSSRHVLCRLYTSSRVNRGNEPQVIAVRSSGDGGHHAPAKKVETADKPAKNPSPGKEDPSWSSEHLA
ncbi:unnamed protein product [Calypogeia fissa]